MPDPHLTAMNQMFELIAPHAPWVPEIADADDAPPLQPLERVALPVDASHLEDDR